MQCTCTCLRDRVQAPQAWLQGAVPLNARARAAIPPVLQAGCGRELDAIICPPKSERVCMRMLLCMARQLAHFLTVTVAGVE
jgi:hypothetical protein